MSPHREVLICYDLLRATYPMRATPVPWATLDALWHSPGPDHTRHLCTLMVPLGLVMRADGVLPEAPTHLHDANAVLDYWHEKTGRRRLAKSAPARLAKIRTRLREGYTVADLCEAIDGILGSEWHTERNIDDIPTVLRNPETVERFQRMARQAAGPKRRAVDTSFAGATRGGAR